MVVFLKSSIDLANWKPIELDSAIFFADVNVISLIYASGFPLPGSCYCNSFLNSHQQNPETLARQERLDRITRKLDEVLELKFPKKEQSPKPHDLESLALSGKSFHWPRHETCNKMIQNAYR